MTHALPDSRLRHVREHIARTAARPLTARQTAVLAFIRAEAAAGRGFPSEWALQDRFRWKYHAAAEDVLLALACRGLIERTGWARQGRRLRPVWRLAEDVP